MARGGQSNNEGLGFGVIKPLAGCPLGYRVSSAVEVPVHAVQDKSEGAYLLSRALYCDF
jgi:hypothetical protein